MTVIVAAWFDIQLHENSQLFKFEDGFYPFYFLFLTIIRLLCKKDLLNYPLERIALGFAPGLRWQQHGVVARKDCLTE